VSHPSRTRGFASRPPAQSRIDVAMELNPRDPAHWPYIGSVVDYVERAETEGPRNPVLPWAFSTRRGGGVPPAGPFGGFLGQAFGPTSAEFVGQATRSARKTLQEQTWDDLEPYRGITPAS